MVSATSSGLSETMESRFPLGETDDDTAGNGGIDVHGDEGADGRFQCKDPRAGHDDDEVQTEDDVADFQIVKFFDNRANDVEAPLFEL